MCFKKMGIAATAVILLMAIPTTNAFAGFEESPGAWRIGPLPGSALAEGSTKTLTMGSVGGLTLTSNIFGAPFKMTATGIKCRGCVIKDVGTNAKEEGVLEFTGVSLTEPSGCEVTEAIQTKTFEATVGMQGGIATVKFVPKEGATLATVELFGAGCSALAGLYKINGAFTAQMTNATGVFAGSQEMSMSKAIQESAGTSLSFGLSSATLTGSVKSILAPEREFSVSTPTAPGPTNQYEASSNVWYTGPAPGSKLAEGRTKAVTTEATTKLSLEGSVAGSPLDLIATGLECKACVIKNVGTEAIEEGNLVFTGLSLTEPEPSHCGVVGPLETSEFKATVGMKKGSTTIATVKFVPKEGELLAVEITGAECSIAGAYSLDGTIFAEASFATGTIAKIQPIKLSVAIQESAGSGVSLKFAGNEAALTGTISEKITSEKEFAVEAPRVSGKPFEESSSAWYTGASPGTKLAEGVLRAISTEVASGGLDLETIVGGTSLDLTATGVSCVSCGIENVGIQATLAGALKFTGVSVSEPASCGAASTIETKKVTGTVGMEQGSGTVGLVKVVPTAGAGTSFATVELTGGSCPIAGLYKVTGTLYGKMNSATGVFGKSQSIALSRDIEESAGTGASVKFGENAAVLTGAFGTKLSPEEEFTASNTSASHNNYSETGGAWYASGTKLVEGSTKSLTTAAVGTQKLETMVAGTKLDITATGVECSGCVIKNVGAAAKVEGALKFTGLTVSEPAGCSIASTITTKALTAVVGMNIAGTLATFKFTPKEGTTFATVELTGEKCAIAGLYKVTGTFFAQAKNATGVFATSQEISLSKAIQESAGTATSLKFGEKAAILTGTVSTGLSPGEEFTVKEK